MNKENEIKATCYSSRIFEDNVFRSPDAFSFMLRMVYNSCLRIKKQRDYRLFIFFSSSKEQGNRTGNPKFACGSFGFLLCIPCPAGQQPLRPTPDGRQVQGRSTTTLLCSRWSHCFEVVLQSCASSSVAACPAI